MMQNPIWPKVDWMPSPYELERIEAANPTLHPPKEKEPIEIEIVGFPDEKTYTQEEVDELVATREREWFTKLYGEERKAIRLYINDSLRIPLTSYTGYFSRTILDEDGRTEMTFTLSGETI